MSCTSATWAAFGLPLPDASGTSYRIGQGLVRTRWADGTVRQRRQYTHWPRQWHAQWTLPWDVLQTMTAWIDSFGEDYQPIPLISGESADGSLIDHDVRFISDLDVRGSANGSVTVSADLEQAGGLTPADTSGWSMPIAMIDGYSYGEDYGLLRTSLAGARADQRRIYTTRPRQFQVTWRLTYAELALAEAWIRANGFWWVSMPLISSESGMRQTTTHTVRVASDLLVTYQPGGVADLSCTLEQACANETGALESEGADNMLACTSGIPSSIPMGLGGAALADDWGDETDWGGAQP